MKLKKMLIILGLPALMISFQNCNAPGTTTNQASKENSKSSSSTSPTSSNSGSAGSSSGLSSGSARSISGGKSSSGSTGFGGVNSGSAGSISSGGGSSIGSSGTCISCGSRTGNIGSGVVSDGNSDTTLKIVKQPISKTINEGTEFFVGVSVQGGISPYTYKWYKDGEELVPKFDNIHYESYSDVLDRIYKEGDYHVVVTDGAGTKVTSSRAQIRMISKQCEQGNYFIDLYQRTDPKDGYTYFNDLFYYKNTKFLVSQNNPTIVMMQLQSFLGHMKTLGFNYFTLGGDVSNNQNFAIECSTDVPTIHTSQCASNNTRKCGFAIPTKKYQGSISFLCRNGYIQFISNTCQLVSR